MMMGIPDDPEIIIDENLVVDTSSRYIRFSKPMFSPEDVVALNFAEVLEEVGIEYVVVAGYVAILFGRARRSDDIDFIVSVEDEHKFTALCVEASKRGFELMQGEISSNESVRQVYRDYLMEGLSIRFVYRDMIVPNVVFKPALTSVHRFAIANSYRVVVNDRYLIRISPLELQIAYKLYLGSDKDVGDAVFLYTLFKKVINHEELSTWCGRLGARCDVLSG